MTKNLYYSVLKYRHGLVLGESLNAGLLFFIPETNSFKFEYGDLRRISNIYPEINLNFLKRFLSTIDRNIKTSNGTYLISNKVESLQEFISKEILFSDAAGLSFGSLEVIPTSAKSDTNQTINYLKQLFLLNLNENSTNRKKRNEDYIISEVINLLKAKAPYTLQNSIDRNKKVSTSLIEFTFDLSWKSDVNHLAKALSFDLENNLLIQNKALQIFGTLEQFDSNLDREFGSFQIDFLVSKPSHKDHFKEFDKALKIIDSSNIHSNISLEADWNQYVNEIIEKAEELSPLS